MLYCGLQGDSVARAVRIFFVSMSLPALLISFLTFVELNCENLFDYRRDSLKADTEFLPEAPRHWTRFRYWKKVNNIAQEIMSCTSNGIPDLVALCEVENDSVMTDLTRRSLLRYAGYEYIMTDSPDARGIDVALLYSPYAFSPVSTQCFRIVAPDGMRPTRDILYVSGEIITGDTIHVFVVHSPSRYDGKMATQPYRLKVAERLCAAIDSLRALSPYAQIIVAGDFNDYATDEPLVQIGSSDLHNVTLGATGGNGIKANYRYKGKWGSIDHVFLSSSMLSSFDSAHINDALFLLEDDELYGGKKPRRTFNGYKYQDGYSDHLPLVVRFRFR